MRAGAVALLGLLVLAASDAEARHPATTARILVDHGDDPVHSSPQTPRSLSILRAVVPIRAGVELCSGVYTFDAAGVPWLLTAAHCIVRTDEAGRIGGLVDAVTVPMPTTVAVARAKVPTSFEACILNSLTYQACVVAGASDIALIPVTGPLGDLTPWTLCSAPPTGHSFNVYGYGLTENGKPPDMRRGAFSIETPPTSGMWHLHGLGQTATDLGDSGGPIISGEDSAFISVRAPHVCFVASGRGIDGSVQTANVQPTWTGW